METNSSEWNFHKKETHTLQVRHLAKSMRQKSPFSASKGKLKVACRRGLVACCAHPRPNARRCTGVAIKQRYSKVMYTQYDTRKAFVSGKQHDLNSNMNTSSTNFNTPRTYCMLVHEKNSNAYAETISAESHVRDVHTQPKTALTCTMASAPKIRGSLESPNHKASSNK